MKKNLLNGIPINGLATFFGFIFLLLSTHVKAQVPVFNSSTMTPICLNGCSSPGSEEIENIMDGNISTKFLDFNTTNTGFVVNTGFNSIIDRIDITTANDIPDRDPVDYTLEASNNGSSWTTLSTGTLICNPTRFSTQSFYFLNTTAYSWYRVSFVNVCNPLDADAMQLAEVQVFVGGTLPIKLISFNSRLTNVNNADIQWVISEPEDGGTYELQRSYEGRNFVTINTQKGNALTTKFSYADAGLAQAVIYYRLKMTDAEGKITYSNIAFVKTGVKTIDVSVYPNPAKKGEGIQLSITNATVESWKLINSTGTTLVQKTNLKIQGSINLSLPAIVSPGIYYLQLQTDKGLINKKIIIQ